MSGLRSNAGDDFLARIGATVRVVGGGAVGLAMVFSLIELLITLAVVAVLAGVVVPVAQTAVQRAKEQELRLALRELRSAIDQYKKAGDEGRIRTAVSDSGYPANLQVLLEGEVDLRDPKQRKIYFLRRIPRDPLHPDSRAAASRYLGQTRLRQRTR
jgi:general secretion pathway protein G